MPCDDDQSTSDRLVYSLSEMDTGRYSAYEQHFFKSAYFRENT